MTSEWTHYCNYARRNITLPAGEPCQRCGMSDAASELKVALSELPSPPSYESAHDDAPLTDHYSAHQMQAYARLAVEAEREKIAAKILADARDWDYSYQKTAGMIVAAIRGQVTQGESDDLSLRSL